MSDDGARAKQYFLSRIWDTYADYYDAFRVDTGATALRIRRWSELSTGLRQVFETEFDLLNTDMMQLVQTVGTDDAVG